MAKKKNNKTGNIYLDAAIEAIEQLNKSGAKDVNAMLVFDTEDNRGLIFSGKPAVMATTLAQMASKDEKIDRMIYYAHDAVQRFKKFQNDPVAAIDDVLKDIDELCGKIKKKIEDENA